MGFCLTRHPHIVLLLCAALLLSARVSADAQEPPPPYVAVVDGPAQIDRQGDVQTAVANMPLVSGDRVSTLEGRVEVLFPDGSALDLDSNSTIELITPIRLSLSAGRAIFVVPGDVSRQYATRYEIDTPISTIVTSGFGTYRADATSASAAWPADAFDQWAEARYGERGAVTAGQYLPQDLRVYSSTLDHSGSWQYDTSYGYVWYPSVAPAWRPYYNGFWEPLPRYGWTWVGTDSWAWPTHHYGRWGYSRTGWFWIPGRTFGPAWVSWGAADGFVSWCPLGFDNRPVFGLSVGPGFPSGGWVVVPRTTFGVRGVYVNRYAVAPQRIPRHAAFVVQNVPPVGVPRDIGRRAAPIGRDAVARPSGARVSTGQAQSVPAPTAVPRAGVPAQTASRQDPRARSVTAVQPIVTQPQQPPPGARRTEAWDRSRVRTPEQTAPGLASDRRTGATAIPRTMPPTPGLATHVEAPRSGDAAHSRGPVVGYGVPRGAPSSDIRPAQAAPRLAAPSGALSQAPVRSLPPASAAPVAVPRAMPAPPQAAPSFQPQAPGRSLPPGSAAPAAVPRAMPAAPPPTPPPAQTAPAAQPDRGAPSRSGGGEGHSGAGAGAGQAQSRRRG